MAARVSRHLAAFRCIQFSGGVRNRLAANYSTVSSKINRIYILVTVHRNRFLITKQTRCNNYPNLFCYKILHVSGIFSFHHQQFSTVHSALVSFMQILMTVPKQSEMELQFHPDSAWKRLSETCKKLASAECTVENS